MARSIAVNRDWQYAYPYYEVIPRHESGVSPDRIESECSACGRIKTKVIYPSPGARTEMAERTWRGHSIFYLGGTLHIVVTENVKKALQGMRPSNLQLTNVSSS